MARLSFLFYLFFFSVFCFLLSLDIGTTTFKFHEFIQAVFLQHNSLNQQIMLHLRLPRTISAFVTGGLLALAGMLMQILLRNPLADPYILGTSGGAAVTSLLLLLLGIQGYWINAGAFLGAILSMFLVFILAKNSHGWSTLRLLLTGVVVASGWSAMISLILTISPDRLLHGMLFWLLGDLSFAMQPGWATFILIGAFIVCQSWARELNILARGENHAKSLGIDTKILNLKIYLICALLTATAVSLAGSIGFVGLITPHLLRLSGITDHRYLVPAVILAGGSFLTLADTLARSVIAPQQLPVGIMTALIGTPVFLWLLKKEGGKQR